MTSFMVAGVVGLLPGASGCDNDKPVALSQSTKPGDQGKKDAPADTKPAPVTPGAAKPDDKDKKDAKGAGGSDKKETAKSGNEILPVTIAGKSFKLELALDPAVRTKGLGQRNDIATDGGMLFGFTNAERRGFVMRDCPIPIDIIYLDGTGHVLSWYQMQPEPPRGEGEGTVGDFNNQKYESRLKQYSSRFATQFVIELKGGTIPSLNLKEGQKIDADWADLKKRSK